MPMRGQRQSLRSSRRRVADGATALRPIPLALCAWLLALCAWLGIVASPTGARANWDERYFPNVRVVDQDGRELKFYDDVIRGKLVVVSFIYLTCRDICPLMTARLARLQDQLGAAMGRDVHFVSITIQPEKDTPELLKEHAQAFGAGPGWTFLTGDPIDVAQVRYKLGERSRLINDHKSEILLGNDRTRHWARDSIFSDLVLLANTVRAMDHEWSAREAPISGATTTQQVAARHAGKAGLDVPGQALFTKTCASCHTIGRGDRVGPDLAGVLARRDRAWLARYIAEPDKMRAGNDQTALALAQKYRAVRMPNLGMSETDVDDLLAFLSAQPTAPRAAEPSTSVAEPTPR